MQVCAHVYSSIVLYLACIPTACVSVQILRGMAAHPESGIDTRMVPDVRNALEGMRNDLAVMDIMRGRDFGLPSFSQARADLGLQRPVTFSDITSDATVAAALSSLYGGNISAVELWVRCSALLTRGCLWGYSICIASPLWVIWTPFLFALPPPPCTHTRTPTLQSAEATMPSPCAHAHTNAYAYALPLVLLYYFAKPVCRSGVSPNQQRATPSWDPPLPPSSATSSFVCATATGSFVSSPRTRV